MEEQILFKTTALGGFEKKAVLAYIDELTAKHHAELAQKEERINSLFAEKQEASHRASESQSLVNSLTGQLQEAQKKLEELEQKLAPSPWRIWRFLPAGHPLRLLPPR